MEGDCSNIKIIYANYKKQLYEVFVDDEDYDLVKRYKWNLTGENGYVRSRKNGKSILIHRLIMSPPDDMEVDHRDHNKRNNQKYNLRVCTRGENQRNRYAYKQYANQETKSQYKGVSWERVKKKWRTQIMIDGIYKELGLFTKEISAAYCYNYWAKYYFGEFAVLNDLEDIDYDWKKDQFIPSFTSKYHGVFFNKRNNKWVAQIWYNKKNKFIGHYDSEIEAALAYNKKAIKCCGSKAKINIIEST